MPDPFALDPFDLGRFVRAQAQIHDQVTEELRAGRKRGHWMGFVFPQLAGLGHSEMAQRYALASLREARAYAEHKLLGPRLVAWTGLVNAVEGRALHDIFGSPDDMKFRSSMTLFARARPEEPAFGEALRRYCGGVPDPRTEALLAARAAAP